MRWKVSYSMALMVAPSSVPRTTPKKYTTAPTLSEILRCESRQASSIGPAVISSFLFIPHFELDALRFPSDFRHAAFYVLAFYSRHSASCIPQSYHPPWTGGNNDTSSPAFKR